MSIVRNENICGGCPTIRGRRLTVFNVVSGIAAAQNDMEKYCSEFELNQIQVLDALNYCKKRTCEEGLKYSNRYCEQCVLDSIYSYDEPINFIPISDGEILYSHENGIIFLGSEEEYKSEQPIEGWLLAAKVLNSIHQ